MQAHSQTGHAPTVLLLEDEVFVREVTREILESAGCRVLCARTVKQATEILRRQNPEFDLLLTDIVLPDGTGCALAADLLRENPYFRVLYVSGYPEQICSLQESGGECLAKPYSSESLLRKVELALGEPKLPDESSLMQVCAVA